MHRARWTDRKLVAASPFRDDDENPSFFCDLTTGGWHDSGTLESGNFVKLLAWLRCESESEVRDYLRDKYGHVVTYDYTSSDDLPDLKINLATDVIPNSYKSIQLNCIGPSTYLVKRGIIPSIQKKYSVTYDPENEDALIPWFDTQGRIRNIMRRSIYDKKFRYISESDDGNKDVRNVSKLVYGLYQALKDGSDTVVLTEAPIDALSLAVADISAVAMGGTTLTDRQTELLVQSGISTVIVLRDNDSPGRLYQRKLIRKLSRLFSVYVAIVPCKYGKDANDCLLKGGVNVLQDVVNRVRPVIFTSKIVN